MFGSKLTHNFEPTPQHGCSHRQLQLPALRIMQFKAVSVLYLHLQLPPLSRSTCFIRRYRQQYEELTTSSFTSGPLVLTGSFNVWCVSDLHVDCKQNMAWIREMPSHLDDVLVCAGDLCTGFPQLRTALSVLKSKFK